MPGLQSGIVEVKYNGQVYRIEGEWNYHDGSPRKETIIGHNFVGPNFTPQARMISGNAKFFSLDEQRVFQSIGDGTFTLRLANGEVLTLEDAEATTTGDTTTSNGLTPVLIFAKTNPNARNGLN